MLELIEGATIASSETKGYKFYCSKLPDGCNECAERLLDFITQDLEAAYQHSRKNNTTFWISKD